MDFDVDSAKKETLSLIDEQQKLKTLKDNKEVQELFEYQLKIVAQKLVYCFTSSKEGDNISNWDEFCKLRGEIIARLEPIQTIYSSEQLIEYLTNQLKTMFTETPENN